MRNKDFRIPFVADIPIKVEQEISKRASQDVSYVKLKEDKISKTYNNSKRATVIRKIGELLLKNFSKELSYKEIAEKTNSKEGVAHIAVADLKFLE